MTSRTTKDGLVLGTTLLVVHSFASFLVFLYCHINTEGQSVFAYFLFFVVDAPTVPLAFEIEGTIGLLTGLTDSWTDLWYYGHQGVNLRAFILTALFGGLHWFVVGNLMSYTIGWIQQRLKLKAKPV
jgi:cbb3-type cytochrome oxidase subunit 1